VADYPRPWRHIAADLRAKIESGRWQPGDRLPTLADLQVEYGVAKGTIQNAIAQLRADGMVTSRRGGGIYVAARGIRIGD
jgi:DNA-binding GntR family transcriptional regulator